MMDLDPAEAATAQEWASSSTRPHTGHVLHIRTFGPPAAVATCSCRDYHITWDAEECQQRGFRTMGDLADGIATDHDKHKLARLDVHARTQRDPAFYA